MIADLWARIAFRTDKDGAKKAEKAIEGIKHRLDALVGIEAIKKVGEWAKEWVNSTVEVADHAENVGQALGITSEAFQELTYAANLADVSQEGLEKSLGKLAVNLDTVARTGEGPAADALERLGIHAKNLRGIPLDKKFELISEKFARMPDGTKKAGIGMALFGKGWKELVPLLNQGVDGIEEARQEAEEFNVVIGKEGVEAAGEFQREQKRTTAQLQGLKNQAVMALLPSLREMLDSLREWITQNKEVIKSAITGTVNLLVDAFKILGFIIQNVVVPALELFVADNDALMAVLIGLTALAVAFAAAWIAGAAPLIAIVAAVALLAYGIIKLIKNWDLVKAKGKAAWDAIKSAARSTWDFIKSIPDQILQGFVALGEGIVNALSSAFNWIVEQAKALPGKVWAAIKDIPVVGRLVRAGESVVGRVANAISAPAMETPSRPAPENASGTNINVGDINVTAPLGSDPKQFGEAIRPHIRGILESEYRRAQD